ncbi:hypothetical protein GSI_10969 [Ganoderma sinense ZZ0214-1]|uniref:Uncharacterized protein n=1 Tax=Ganoderma sinense ZZ0214-1 TaxID=1077348 RepID=A0A2G8S225_9APHY|nr:hypothetical protein GSI_10969 [Ganoderma sinense ZZ0214-1]
MLDPNNLSSGRDSPDPSVSADATQVEELTAAQEEQSRTLLCKQTLFHSCARRGVNVGPQLLSLNGVKLGKIRRSNAQSVMMLLKAQ